MKINNMRRIDTWFGVPLCFILTLIRKLVDKFNHVKQGEIKKILFVKPAEQGAIVLAYPAIMEAIEKVAYKNVYFLVFDKNRNILDAMDVIPSENIITVSTKNALNVLIGFIKAIIRIRRENIDTAIDMEFFSRVSAIICYLSGAKRRVGLHSFNGEGPYRGNLMTHPIPYNCHFHTIDIFSILAQSIDIPMHNNLGHCFLKQFDKEYSLPHFQPGREELDELREIICSKIGKIDIPPIIILNANASDLLPFRCWPTQNYIELAKELLIKYPEVYIIFTGTKEEADAAQQIVATIQSDRCISLAGEITFRQLMALYTISNILVTNDSGPAHFASLSSISIIVLFGPETPIVFAPKSPKAHVVYSGLVCSPCVSAFNGRKTKCQNNICMQTITVNNIFSKTCEIYDLSLQHPNIQVI